MRYFCRKIVKIAERWGLCPQTLLPSPDSHCPSAAGGSALNSPD